VCRIKYCQSKQNFTECRYKVCLITIKRELFRRHTLNMSHVRCSSRNCICRRRDCKLDGPNYLWLFGACKDKWTLSFVTTYCTPLKKIIQNQLISNIRIFPKIMSCYEVSVSSFNLYLITPVGLLYCTHIHSFQI
jgi:hypothetical protein